MPDRNRCQRCERQSARTEQRAETRAQSLTCLMDGPGLRHGLLIRDDLSAMALSQAGYCTDPDAVLSQLARRSCIALLTRPVPTLADPANLNVSLLLSIRRPL